MADLANLLSSAPDLTQFLDADPQPTFLIPIDLLNPIEFRILKTNTTFDDIECLNGLICRDSNASLLFRSWAQALKWRESYDFADYTWIAFSIQARWKAIRGIKQIHKSAHGLPIVHKEISRRLEDAEKLQKDASMLGARLDSLQKMMEMSDVGVFEYHLNGTLTRANESWYRQSLHPHEREQHKDFSFMDLVYPPDIPLVMAKWNKLIQGTPVTFEMRWKASVAGKDQEASQWVLASCVPVFDDEGILISIAGNTIDISGQKQMQREALQRAEALERARASEMKFARFAELAPVAIYIFDPQKRMIYCNQKFFEITGHSIVEPKKFLWTDVIHPEDIPIVEEDWRVLLEETMKVQTQFRLRRQWKTSDGKARQTWAQYQSLPEVDSEGNVVSIMGTLTDISAFVWAEDIQRTRVEEALEAKRQQENFIDMNSHELRNPMSAVVQCADSSLESLNQIAAVASTNMLDDFEKNLMIIQQEVRSSLDALETIISCSLHQKRVVDDILTLSKLDSNLILITPIPVQPAQVVADAVKMFDVECHNEGIDLAFLEDPSLASVIGKDVQVLIDPSRINQILINLITNSIKFVRGRPVKRVRVTLGASAAPLPDTWHDITFAPSHRTSNDLLDQEEWGEGKKAYLWITIEDTGCGISQAERGILFTRFTQASPRTHVHCGGSGLGLFISKSMAERQSGRIGLKSEPYVGTTFAFFVGSRLVETKTDATQEPTIPSDLEPAIPISQVVRASNYSVLIVEDNIVNQTVLSRQLQKAGLKVYLANHGSEALAFLTTTRFWHTKTHDGVPLTLVLMDIEMPVMDGLTCARRIREMQQRKEIVAHVPLLAVSANARSEQVKKAKEAGMDDAIAKPFRIVELLPKIIKLASMKINHIDETMT